MTDQNRRPIEGGGYPVEVRQYGAPYQGAPEICGLGVRGIEFNVKVDQSKVPVRRDQDEQVEANRYWAAREAIGAIANGTDWPPRKYAVKVQGWYTASTYVAEIGEHREFTLKPSEGPDWPF